MQLPHTISKFGYPKNGRFGARNPTSLGQDKYTMKRMSIFSNYVGIVLITCFLRLATEKIINKKLFSFLKDFSSNHLSTILNGAIIEKEF